MWASSRLVHPSRPTSGTPSFRKSFSPPLLPIWACHPSSLCLGTEPTVRDRWSSCFGVTMTRLWAIWGEELCFTPTFPTQCLNVEQMNNCLLKSHNNALISITSYLFIHMWVPKNKEYLWVYQNIMKAFFPPRPRVLGNSFNFINLLQYLRNLKLRKDVKIKSGERPIFNFIIMVQIVDKITHWFKNSQL